MTFPAARTMALPEAAATAARQTVGTTLATVPGPTGNAPGQPPGAAGTPATALSFAQRKAKAIGKVVDPAIVTDNRASFLGNPIANGVHEKILPHLRAAEGRLRFKLGDPKKRTMSIGGKQPPGHSRHSLGVAIDIDYATNPYILLEDGESEYDKELVKVYERIARFAGRRASAIAEIGKRRTPALANETAEERRDRVFSALTTESALMQDYFRMMIDQKRLRDFLASEIGRTNFAGTPWDFTPPAVPDTANPAGPANVDAVTRNMQADWVMLTWDTHGPPIAMLPDAAGAARNAFPYRPAPRFPPIKVKNAKGDLVDGPAPDAAFKAAGSGLSVRSPLSGFITLELDIVQALTDSGFGWGPATWGLDVMHFEVMSVAAQIERDLAAEMAKE